MPESAIFGAIFTHYFQKIDNSLTSNLFYGMKLMDIHSYFVGYNISKCVAIIQDLKAH
jgi:hypothetical protein